MKPVVITEYERIYYADDIPSAEWRKDGILRLPRRLLERLHAFDERQASDNGNRLVFDWSARKHVAATSQVGVIQIPGLCIEILPKIDRPCDAKPNTELAQKNLLYMLSLTRNIPIEERDLAGLETEKSFLETLVAVFARRLLDELRRGLDHAYVHHEQNLPILKGKLLSNQQIKRNASHRERVFIGYDEFVADTPLNRIFKAVCRRLYGMVSGAEAQKSLREALAVLDEVRDCLVGRYDFDKIHLTRNNERFAVLLSFCRMVILGHCPAPVLGPEQTFSLLFPMEKLFEEFVAALMIRNAARLGLERSAIHPQAKGRREWLVYPREHGGNGRFKLVPDIIIDGEYKTTCCIVDTKWKRLDAGERNYDISQTDMYQLYAYANRYRCKRSILLYPQVDGDCAPLHFHLRDEDKRCIRVEFLNLNRDLRREKEAVIEDLSWILSIDARRMSSQHG